MISFKKNDKVVCIDNIGVEIFLTLHKTYTIKVVSTKYIYITDNTGRSHSFYSRRFKKWKNLDNFYYEYALDFIN